MLTKINFTVLSIRTVHTYDCVQLGLVTEVLGSSQLREADEERCEAVWVLPSQDLNMRR